MLEFNYYSCMKEGTIFSLILGRIDLRGNFSTRLRQVEKLKPLKDGPLLHLCKMREEVVGGPEDDAIRAAEAAQMLPSCIVVEGKGG